jgi:hypothetical protein
MPGHFDPRIRTKPSKTGTGPLFEVRIAKPACRKAEIVAWTFEVFAGTPALVPGILISECDVR